jgi:hypothetical protein
MVDVTSMLQKCKLSLLINKISVVFQLIVINRLANAVSLWAYAIDAPYWSI